MRFRATPMRMALMRGHMGARAAHLRVPLMRGHMGARGFSKRGDDLSVTAPLDIAQGVIETVPGGAVVAPIFDIAKTPIVIVTGFIPGRAAHSFASGRFAGRN